MPTKWFEQKGSFDGPVLKKRDELLEVLGVKMSEQVEGSDLGEIRVGETKDGEVVAAVDKPFLKEKRWLFGIIYSKSLEERVNENS